MDASRVAVMGRSYGGYMTLASMVAFPTRLRCAVDTCGMSSFLSFMESMPEWRRDMRRPEYGDERIPAVREFLHNASPLTHCDRMTTPVLIIQGARDTRVPLGEALQVFEAVERNGGEPWLFVADHEGHIFKRKEVMHAMSEVVLTFLRAQLLG